MKNLVRRLREALNLNQADFAREIGRSVQMLQLYERGSRVPDEVMDRLREIAAAHSLAEIMAELGLPDGTTVRRVFHPGEKIISQARGHTTVATRRKQMHDLLDEIFDSGSTDAIEAVESNLVVFAKYVRRQPGARRGSAKSG